jgi:catechol 2,3-dioxygenase-like lactoylglutathione lyase family enzyme
MIVRVWDITFTVSDLERAVEFYESTLGLTKKYQFATYAGFDCGGVEIGLQPGSMSLELRGAPSVTLQVADVDRAYRTLVEQGIGFLETPRDTAWGGRIARLADPDGNVLQLVQIDWPTYFSVCAR